MRKIDKIMFRAIIPPFLIALSVLTFIVFMHEAAARAGTFNLSALLITQNASPLAVLIITGGLLPGILIFTLPLSFLIGILIGLSGLSGESQITALRACGVPIRRLLAFILFLGAFIGLATATLSMFVIPRTNDIIKLVKNQISVMHAASQVKPRTFFEKFPNKVLYINDLTPDKLRWSGIFLADNSNSAAPRTLLARSGFWIEDPDNRRLQLHLENGYSYATDSNEASRDNVIFFTSTDIPVVLNQVAFQEAQRKHKKTSELRTCYLWQNYSTVGDDKKIEYLVELNQRMALPFSFFPFALIGLALGVSAKKGGRTFGFALSLIVVIIFYILFINGIRLALIGKINPWLGAWGADIVLSLIGLLLLIKVERGVLFSRLSNDFLLISGWNKLKLNIAKFRVPGCVAGGLIRFRFPKVLDLYISRGFFLYFFWSLLTCGTLFVIFTLFDLLDDIIRNSIPLIYVVEYFVFLTPQILMWSVPMSVLLAVLINFGILEKNSEITAIKAGGWSLYRISIPVILIASSFCAGLFMLQDYVLPYANSRQDSIRNEIKGRPPQTSSLVQRKWIFGESSRIYNYQNFDGRRNSFIDLNIYDIDFNAIGVLRHIHASQARIDSSGQWILQNGWIRDYRSKSFERINTASFKFPEKSGYFKTEVFQPKESSKRTYSELNSYIKHLSISGYNSTELEVELYKKIAFPLSCLVMALLGVPFSFSTGKKGAFFGIAVSVAIAISYWGVSGLFEAMGDYGLLLPVLSAWAPNLLFGATGLALLFTIRT